MGRLRIGIDQTVSGEYDAEHTGGDTGADTADPLGQKGTTMKRNPYRAYCSGPLFNAKEKEEMGELASCLEQAGFEIRDVVTHLFGSGFPKSTNISKQLDKQAGAEREVVGKKRSGISRVGIEGKQGGVYAPGCTEEHKMRDITAPSTPEAKQWDGWGTSMKPSNERWLLIRKPLKAVPLDDSIFQLNQTLGGLSCQLLSAKFVIKNVKS